MIEAAPVGLSTGGGTLPAESATWAARCTACDDCGASWAIPVGPSGCLVAAGQRRLGMSVVVHDPDVAELSPEHLQAAAVAARLQGRAAVGEFELTQGVVVPGPQEPAEGADGEVEAKHGVPLG